MTKKSLPKKQIGGSTYKKSNRKMVKPEDRSTPAKRDALPTQQAIAYHKSHKAANTLRNKATDAIPGKKKVYLGSKGRRSAVEGRKI